MLGETRWLTSVRCLAIIMCFVVAFLICFTATTTPTADIAFAAESEAMAASVGDSATVTFSALPIEACQDCTWTLTFDGDKTGSITYSIIKNKDPQEYLSLDISGNSCTVSVLKYYKVGITYSVYFILTATSTENAEMTASCSIQLG